MRPVTVGIGGCSARQKVEVPPVAPELAVGDALEPDRFLLDHRFADCGVLRGAQRIGARLAPPPARAGFGERRRTQQAADLVGAKRRLRHYFLRAGRFAGPEVLRFAPALFLADALRRAGALRRFGAARMPAGLSTKS